MSLVSAPSLYPSASQAALKLNFLGKHLKDVPAPAAVMDVAPIRRNCKAMPDTANALGVKFRAHVKTHKTTELTRLQMGEDPKDVRLVASTIAEIENLAPYLLECKAKGSNVNVLYGLPIALSHTVRLAAVTRMVGEGSVGLFIDHPAQVQHLAQLDDSVWPGEIPVFVKIDAGYHRAGLAPESDGLDALASLVASQTKVRIVGAYAHMGNSYGSGSPKEALAYLLEEIKGAQAGANRLAQALPSGSGKLTISVGATPTATSAQNMLLGQSEGEEDVRAYIEQVQQSYDVELHAGVYPVLDMQQLATRARPSEANDQPLLSTENLSLRIMVEIASVYTEREKPEALVCAGAIVLGREPCKSYPGWGVVTPWGEQGVSSAPVYDPGRSQTGWIMGRISQEHGSLTWEGPQDDMRRLEVGEKVMLWPNHACMAGPNFGWYLVVDSDSEEPDVVRDVWVRWRGW